MGLEASIIQEPKVRWDPQSFPGQCSAWFLVNGQSLRLGWHLIHAHKQHMFNIDHHSVLEDKSNLQVLLMWLNFKMILKEEAARGQFNPRACSFLPQRSKHRVRKLISHQHDSTMYCTWMWPDTSSPMLTWCQWVQTWGTGKWLPPTQVVCRRSNTVPPLLSPFPQEALDLEGQKKRIA